MLTEKEIAAKKRKVAFLNFQIRVGQAVLDFKRAIIAGFVRK